MRFAFLLVFVLSACPATTSPDKASPEKTTKAQQAKAQHKGDIPAPFDLDRAVVVIESKAGPQRFKVQVAKLDKERQRGLMYVESMPDDEGMIFLFEKQEQRSFWMKNTWIALDMLFIDEDHVVTGIVENAEPLTTSSRKINGATRFVLEVNGGLTRKLGIAAGDKVTWEGAAQPLWTSSVEASTETP